MTMTGIVNFTVSLSGLRQMSPILTMILIPLPLPLSLSLPLGFVFESLTGYCGGDGRLAVFVGGDVFVGEGDGGGFSAEHF